MMGSWLPDPSAERCKALYRGPSPKRVYELRAKSEKLLSHRSVIFTVDISMLTFTRR